MFDALPSYRCEKVLVRFSNINKIFKFQISNIEFILILFIVSLIMIENIREIVFQILMRF